MPRRLRTDPVFWPPDECLHALHTWVKTHGRVPSCNGDWRRAGQGHPSGRTCERNFGSWDDFIRAGGYKPNTAGMPAYWTKERVRDWLLDEFFRRGGEWPTVPELRRASHCDRPGYCTILRLFGNYTKAKRYAGWAAECSGCTQPLGRDARGSQRFCSVKCRNRFYKSRPACQAQP